MATVLFITSLIATSLHQGARFVEAASPNDVIINELMYNPNTGNQDDEYIELYNTTGSDIDLGGWSFNAGITLSFASGTIIASNDYLIVSPNIPQTLTTYGVVSSTSYAGSNLSNGGETVTLIDASANVIDTVNYDDASPWPTSPDGTGHSLELKGTGLDNSDPANWGGSVDVGGTPLAQNSQVGLNLATISNVPDPNDISPNQAVLVTAEVAGTGITSVELKYVVNFDAEQTLTMYDDGTNGDVTLGDDVYTAEIPGQAEKSLVRFRVLVTNASGTQQSPSIDDSQDYHGYYIRPSITTNAEVLDWFIEDSAYTDMVTNHVYDNLYFNGVVVYGNDVYDNTKFRVRGDTSRDIDKKSFKVKLPAGNEIVMNGSSGIPTDEFELLHSTNYSISYNTVLAWVNDQAGLPSPDMVVARIERNGEFHGLFTWSNKYQSKWRIANGFNTGELYEDSSEVVSGANDSTRLTGWYNMMLSGEDITGSSQLEIVLDNYDIPNNLAYLATLSAVAGSDHFNNNNTLQYYDIETGRWKGLLWDQEASFNRTISISPYDTRGSEFFSCYTYCAPYGHRSIRELYLRRLRTVIDKLYTSDQLLDKFTELETLYADDMLLDMTSWPLSAGGSPRLTPTQVIENFTILYNDRKRLFLSFATGLDWGLPDAQSEVDEQQVSFDVITPSATDADEYIRLYNAASTLVDISGWVIEGINYTLPQGAVIPAQGVVYLLKDDIGYKASHDPVLVMGQYSNDLGGSGTLVLKNAGGTTIDSEGY